MGCGASSATGVEPGDANITRHGAAAESKEAPPPFSPELPPPPPGFAYPGSSTMATVAAIDWKPIAHKLPIGKDAASKEKRAELFMRFDPNGNGYLSLAEVDKGVRDVLEIDELFDCKPAIMRAFQASKAYDKNCTAELGEDFITRSEFRVLLVYLRCYFELFQLFDAYDTNKDRRISMSEFKRLAKVNHILANWGMQITDPDTEFKKIDKNGGGFILFDEFSEWALKRKMEVETYDD